MKRFYLTGQRTFGNRGCEAIVRSTVAALRSTLGDIQVLLPSGDIARDSEQWPGAAASGVEFVPAYTSRLTRPWVHAQRLPLPLLKQADWPFPYPKWLRESIGSADVVISIGGDNYSLDYRLPSPLMGLDRLAMDMGKPVFLWGASVGPFEREPHFIPKVRAHLSRMRQVFVRESVSFQYLTEQLGLNNVTQMVDPAFTLASEKLEIGSFWPEHSGAAVIGLNVSPLIERYKKPGQNLPSEVVAFVRHLVVSKGYGVLLIPHVVPLDGSGKNNDALYMKQMLASCGDLGTRIRMAPSHLNAAQMKYLIGQCRFFIGARTHATIAALSSGVPTISIAYSVKAIGINRDLFGDDEVVLPTPEVCTATLISKVEYLENNEHAQREMLLGRMPAFRSKVLESANLIVSSE